MLRPCIGCGTLIDAGSRCPACQRLRRPRGRPWRRLREVVFARHGRTCWRPGCGRPATDIRPRRPDRRRRQRFARKPAARVRALQSRRALTGGCGSTDARYYCIGPPPGPSTRPSMRSKAAWSPRPRISAALVACCSAWRIRLSARRCRRRSRHSANACCALIQDPFRSHPPYPWLTGGSTRLPNRGRQSASPHRVLLPPRIGSWAKRGRSIPRIGDSLPATASNVGARRSLQWTRGAAQKKLDNLRPSCARCNRGPE
jgi:hypothetical protein